MALTLSRSRCPCVRWLILPWLLLTSDRKCDLFSLAVIYNLLLLICCLSILLCFNITQRLLLGSIPPGMCVCVCVCVCVIHKRGLLKQAWKPCSPFTSDLWQLSPRPFCSVKTALNTHHRCPTHAPASLGLHTGGPSHTGYCTDFENCKKFIINPCNTICHCGYSFNSF